MSFDCLGPFRAQLTAPIAMEIVAAARSFAQALPYVNPGDREAGRDPGISRIYGHWSVQAQGCVDVAYNAVVTKEKGIFAVVPSTDVRLNARTYDAHGNVNDLPAGYAEHTYRRNTGAIGIALDGMDGTGVTPYGFGDDGVTTTGLLFLCAAIAGAAHAYDIDIAGLSLDSDPFYGETSFLTHGEAARYPGTPAAYEPYFVTDAPSDGDTRWDLSLFVPLPAGEPMLFDYAVVCGNALRTVAHRIKAAL